MTTTVKALLLDLEGTLYFKGAQIPGAAAALADLTAMGLQLRFLTNTDAKTGRTICRDMAGMDLQIDPAQVFTPATAVQQFLRQHPDKSCHCLLSAELAAEFAPYLKPDQKPDYVIVGDFRESVSYDGMNEAFQHIMAGAELIALQKGRYFIRNNGYNLDTGAFVQLFEYASGKTARVLGKPNAEFFQLALDQLQLTPADVLIVGDDISSDIAGAKNVGARSVMVRTGKYNPNQMPIQPDYLIDSIADLPGLLKRL